MKSNPEEVEALKLKYEKIAANTKRHHWVPQFYLGYFSSLPEGEQVYMYQPPNDPLLTNVANIAASKDLYTFEQVDGSRTRVMEGIFSEHEGEVKQVLDRVLREETLPVQEEDRGHIAAFVSILKTRGPSFRDWLRNMQVEHEKLNTQLLASNSEHLRQKFARAGITFATDEEFEEMRKFMADPSRYTITVKGGEEFYFKRAMELSREMYEIFMTEKSWHLLVAPDRRHFVTSDNPVVIQEIEECPWELAGGVLNGTVLLAISPKLCLALRRIPLMQEKVLLTREDVDHINRSIVMAARRQVYGHVLSKDIQHLCEESLTGDASSVQIRQVAKFAPYYMTENAPQQKEAKGIRKYSRRII